MGFDGGSEKNWFVRLDPIQAICQFDGLKNGLTLINKIIQKKKSTCQFIWYDIKSPYFFIFSEKKKKSFY